MTLKVSAIITTFNRPHLVGNAIRSVLSQSVPVGELLVIDDGSEPESGTAVRSALSDAPVKAEYIRKQNGGMASALNLGLEMATHDWIAFLDDDDVWARDHIQRLQEIVLSQPSLGAVAGLRMENGRLQTPPAKMLIPYDQKGLLQDVIVRRHRPLTEPFFTPVVGTALVRRDLALKLRFSEKAAGRLDIHFFWRLGSLCDFGLDLTSHGSAGQERESFLSTDWDAPAELKQKIALRRSASEIAMLTDLLDSGLASGPIFEDLLKQALVGRSYMLRSFGAFAEARRWLTANRRELPVSAFLKEYFFTIASLRPRPRT